MTIIGSGYFTEDVTVPAYVTLQGVSPGGCTLDGDITLEAGGYACDVTLADGHYIEQDGVKYYA